MNLCSLSKRIKLTLDTPNEYTEDVLHPSPPLHPHKTTSHGTRNSSARSPMNRSCSRNSLNASVASMAEDHFDSDDDLPLRPASPGLSNGLNPCCAVDAATDGHGEDVTGGDVTGGDEEDAGYDANQDPSSTPILDDTLTPATASQNVSLVDDPLHTGATNDDSQCLEPSSPSSAAPVSPIPDTPQTPTRDPSDSILHPVISSTPIAPRSGKGLGDCENDDALSCSSQQLPSPIKSTAKSDESICPESIDQEFINGFYISRSIILTRSFLNVF